MAEKSAFVRQASWCVPERKRKSDEESGVIIGHCLRDSGTAITLDSVFEFPVVRLQNAWYLSLFCPSSFASAIHHCKMRHPYCTHGIVCGMDGVLPIQIYNPGVDCSCGFVFAVDGRRSTAM